VRGDQADFVSRLRLTLPEGWVADDAPTLRGLLAGLAAGWAWLFGLLQSVRSQARLASVTDRFLDLACVDFFGQRLGRRIGEGDAALRGRLLRAMQRERGTRAGLVAAALEAGYVAAIFEPGRPLDTGAYGTLGDGSYGLAWGLAGGWGSLAMPLACFVTVTATAPVSDPGRGMAEAMPAGGVAWIRYS